MKYSNTCMNILKENSERSNEKIEEKLFSGHEFVHMIIYLGRVNGVEIIIEQLGSITLIRTTTNRIRTI